MAASMIYSIHINKNIFTTEDQDGVIIKGTQKATTPSNKTQQLTKSMDMDIWVIGTLN